MKRISSLAAFSVLSLFASIAMAHPGNGIGMGGGMGGGAAGMGAAMGMGSMASMSHGSYAATPAMNVNGTMMPAMPNNPIAQEHVIANRANATANDSSTTDSDSTTGATTPTSSTTTSGSTTTTSPWNLNLTN